VPAVVSRSAAFARLERGHAHATGGRLSGVPTPSWLIRLVKMLGIALLTTGAASVAAGVIYWLKHWKYDGLVLLLGLMLGFFLSGAGVLLIWPSSRRARRVAATCFAGSASALAVLWLTDSILLGLPAAAVAGGGAVTVWLVLSSLRRR